MPYALPKYIGLKCPHHLKNSESSFITKDNDNDKQYEDVQIILMTGQAIKNEIFFNQNGFISCNRHIFSRTVAGKQWFHNYLKHLDDNSLNNVKIIPSKVTFKFGDSPKLYSEMKATIPAQITQTNCFVKEEKLILVFHYCSVNHLYKKLILYLIEKMIK